ncbi:MAG: DEAD/DEAH box helicase [Intrasporangium sp.]|uniref:DEAD/DEAH box helicase n=1 Tax=Intrasporangium sp. TaxID=1925024 RepID=UPI0026496181|nr:DEAD/DEAH box helicase [Intrasporangium sp.]MDN5795211.1 DEAD/DEAH box helicase [Intrasporangium sp.]
MPKKPASGTAKKARWTPAQKKAARSAAQTPDSRTRQPRRGASAGPGTSRPAHHARVERDDRRSFDRPDERRDSWERRDDRPRHDRRDDRRSFDRRDDRPRDDRRDDRRSFDRRDDRPRDDRRDDRRSFDRRDDRRSFDRRDDRPRHDRRSFDRRDERRSFEPRDDQARQGRPERREGPEHRRSWERRNDRPRSAQPRGRFDRVEEHHDAEAERLEADTWTKATRTPVSDGPVEVAEDNGFAALGLPPRLVERLARDGITQPFPIQQAAIPDALAGRDVLGRGRTGSGKTLAFGLPTIVRLLQAGTDRSARRPRALVLVPTRELAMQVSDALEPLVHVVGLRHKLVAGGLSYTTQINALNKGIDLLIATPGRLNDLLERGAVELDELAIAIVDEADHMAEMGFLAEITTILDRIPAGGQRLLFSATLDHGIDGLVERYLTDPVVHSTDDVTASVETMEHLALLIDPVHKKPVTAELANRAGRTLVFCRTKLGADRVARQLREQGVMAAALHGGLTQGARNRVLGAFRRGTLPVLVATDVAARGIHVDDISLVLQTDPPADHKDYLHRSGRTARAGERGTVVTLVLPHQRRTVERQLADAGVDTALVKARPGDALIAATGASEPNGIPIDEADYTRLLEGPKKRRPQGARGPRQHRPGRPYHGEGRADRHGDRRGDRRPARERKLVDRWGEDATA